MPSGPRARLETWVSLVLVGTTSIMATQLGDGAVREMLIAVVGSWALIVAVTLGRPTRLFKSEYLDLDDEDAAQRHDSRARRYAVVFYVIWLPAIGWWFWHTL